MTKQNKHRSPAIAPALSNSNQSLDSQDKTKAEVDSPANSSNQGPTLTYQPQKQRNMAETQQVPTPSTTRNGPLPPLLLQCKHVSTYEGLEPWHIKQLQFKLSLLLDSIDSTDTQRFPWQKDLGIHNYRMKVTPDQNHTSSTHSSSRSTGGTVPMERIRFIMEFEESILHLFHELVRDYSMIYNLNNITSYFWKNNIVSKRILQPINATTGLAILELAGTWPGMNRDTLVVYHFQLLQDGRILYMLFSADERLNQGFHLRKTVVRANVIMFGFVLESMGSDRTKVTGIWQVSNFTYFMVQKIHLVYAFVALFVFGFTG
jgi:hypothetical protein